MWLVIGLKLWIGGKMCFCRCEIRFMLLFGMVLGVMGCDNEFELIF